MAENEKLKVVFGPGVLEQMERDMDPEELQAVLDEIKELVEGGTFFDMAQEMDAEELKESDPDLYNLLISTDTTPPKRTLH